MENHQGSATSDNNYNGGLIFDCFEPFILLKTKVITTVPGERKINLLAANGDIIQTKIVNIPSGTTVIDLNFEVPVGTDYELTTDAPFNQSSIGSAGPQLRRSNQGCAFPYEIPGILSIKNSSFNTERYYYFYNWEVSLYGYTCTSERVPVTVVIETGSSTTTLPSWASDLQIFPNPSTGVLNLNIQGFAGGVLRIAVKNAQGQTLQTRTLNAPRGDAAFSTDLSAFPAGIYWLELASEGGVAQRKVVIR
jgi:hypothetical protein